MATLRQKAAVKKILESNGTMPVSRAMLEVGYPPATAKNPQQLTESKGYQELLEEYLPDKIIFAVHSKALHAKKIITSHTEPDYEVDDIPTQLRAVDMAYKVKGKYDADAGSQGNNTMNIGTLINNFTEENATR